MAKYEAHAFHEEFDRGRGSGVLNISGPDIYFVGSGKSVSMPLKDAEFKLGGASDRLLFMTHASKPGLTLYTSDLSILKDAALRDLPVIRAQLNKARRKRTFNWSLLIVVVALLVGTPIALVTNVDWLTGVIAKEIPAQWEAELGESAFADFQKEKPLIEDKATTRSLNAMTATLIATAANERYVYRISIANDPDLNAFALPGGRIVLNSGLILAAEDASEVLGVVAHEIAHVTEQHGVRNIMAVAGTFVLLQALAGDVSGVLALLVNATPFLVGQSYSREFESQADEIGFTLLQDAAIDPQGIITFLERVRATEHNATSEATEDEIPRGIADNALAYLSSHPATDKRIARLQALNAQREAAEFRNPDKAFRELQLALEKYVAGNAEKKDEG